MASGVLITNDIIREILIKGRLSKAQAQIVFTVIDESWAWIDRRRSRPGQAVRYETTRKPLKPKDFADRTGMHISDVCKVLTVLLEARAIRRHWNYYRVTSDVAKWDPEALQGKSRGSSSRPKVTREIPQPAREIPPENEENALGKIPNGTREIPHSNEGNSLARWPAILRAARDPELLYSLCIQDLYSIWGKYTSDPDYFDKTKDLRYSVEQIQAIADYWILLKHTRTSGKIAPSVVENTMESWERFTIPIVIEALRIHKTKFGTDKSKREDYTLGIMRRLKREVEASGRDATDPELFAHGESQAREGAGVRQFGRGAQGNQGQNRSKTITDDELAGLGFKG